MSWTNDTKYPVLIRGYKIKQGSRGYVKFELYSGTFSGSVANANTSLRRRLITMLSLMIGMLLLI